MTDHARLGEPAGDPPKRPVLEIIEGNGVPIAERFHPDVVATLVPVPPGVVVEVGYLWDGQTFSAPPSPAPAVVESIARWAALYVLSLHGLLEGARAAVDAEGGAWPFRWDMPTWSRPDALAIGAKMTPPLPPGDVDALLEEAAAIAAAAA